ncbi:MAG: hypothetical protein ACRD1H_12270 [Vicinamibacterales bacterium]
MRVLTAILPLGLTPLLLYAIAEGHLSFGGGEKDLVLLLPWTLWSLVFAISAIVLWWRQWPHRRALQRSALIGLGVLVLVAVCLAAVGSLGVAGRF